MLSIKQAVLCFLLVSGFACTRADAAPVPADADSAALTAGFSPSRALREQNGTVADRGRDILKEQRPRWVLLTVFLLFLAVGAIGAAFPGDFALIVRAFYQEQRLRRMGNTDNTLTSWPYVFLFLLFTLVLGLFVVLAESVLGQQWPLAIGRFLETAAVMGALFVLKILTTRLVGPVFGADRLARKYIALLYLIYFNGAFFLMPFLLAAIFAPDRHLGPVLASSGIVAIVLAYRFLTALPGLFRHLKFSVLYLILYLCTLEIAPVIVLIKVLGT